MNILEEQLTIEDLGRCDYKLYQSKDCFRFGTDTALLAWFVASFTKQGKAQSVLELGAGNGAASILVAARNQSTIVDAVEILPKSYELINKNIQVNDLTSRIHAYNADIRILPAQVKNKQYDVVMFNPPFFAQGTGPKAANANVVGARAEEMGTLDDFVATAATRVVQSKGYICMVMHASRLSDVMASFARYKVKATALMAVHPFADRNAEMFLIAGKKGAKGSDIRILPPLILNERSGDGIIPTEKIREIYEEEHTDCFIW